MKVIDCEHIPAAPVAAEGSAGCRIRCLIGPDDGAPSFSMRHFEVAPGGHTPEHAHGHEHEVFILEGTGVVRQGTQEHALRPGTVVYVPPKQMHQFCNTGAMPLRFLCLIPHPLRGLADACLLACGCQ